MLHHCLPETDEQVLQSASKSVVFSCAAGRWKAASPSFASAGIHAVVCCRHHPLTPALLVPVQIVLFCVGAAQAMAVTLLPACAALTPWWQGQSFSLPVMGLVSVHAGGRPLAAACVCPCQHTSKLS